MPGCSDSQHLKDCCLIIVGDGEVADEILAKRRLEAGGRLCHILTKGLGDSRVKVENFSNDGSFHWQPLAKMSPFAKRLGGSISQAWTKTGPDGIVLPDDHKLVVAQIDDNLQRVHMVNGEGEVVMEMTGWVVLYPTMQVATTASVEVQNMHMKAMGTFSGRGISMGSLVSFAVLLIHFLLIIFAERSLQSLAPVLRFVFYVPASMAMSGPPMVKVLAFALCGDDLTWRQAWSVGMLGLVVASAVAISTGMALSAAMWGFVGYSVWCIVLCWVYYSGRHRHTSRKFWPRLAWLTCVFLVTAGGMALVATSILIYASMVESNQTILAAIFLPSATAGAEIGLVKLIQIAHRKLICMRPSEDMTSGDQLFIVVPITVMAVHASCEAARLMAMFLVTVADGGFTWVGSAVVTFSFNLLMRSGWTSFLMFLLCKLFCGRRFAARRFAPNSFNKLHNHSQGVWWLSPIHSYRQFSCGPSTHQRTGWSTSSLQHLCGSCNIGVVCLGNSGRCGHLEWDDPTMSVARGFSSESLRQHGSPSTLRRGASQLHSSAALQFEVRGANAEPRGAHGVAPGAETDDGLRLGSRPPPRVLWGSSRALWPCVAWTAGDSIDFPNGSCMGRVWCSVFSLVSSNAGGWVHVRAK